MIWKGSEHFCAKVFTLHCGVEGKVSRCIAGGFTKSTTGVFKKKCHYLK